MDTETRAGFVAIIGLPNAGKSSLLNQMLGSKLSIVTSAAQTTRERVVGIDTRGGVQIIFMDTPGLVDPAYLLHEAMLGIVQQTVQDADVVVLLLDGTRPMPDFSAEIARTISSLGARLVVAINKTDLAPTGKIRDLETQVLERFQTPAARISATTGQGVEELRQAIGLRLPPSPFLYPDDDLSTQSVRFFVSELIRETVFERYKEEIPYSTAVRIEEFREGSDPLFIRATILVERASQKGILIGTKGQAIRELGAVARQKIEQFVEQRVYLDLWVKVVPRWRKDPVELKRLGFSIPDSD
jgi:GTPase